MANTQESAVWPVNELGEIVVTAGTGSTNIVGYLNSSFITSDPKTNVVKMAFGSLVSNVGIATSIDMNMKVATQSLAASSTPSYSTSMPALIAGNRYYIDPVAGDDINNGTSPATPWKNLTKINGLNPGNGAIIHLASDGIFEYVDTIANYFVSANRKFPGNNCDNLRSTNAAAPIVVKPYTARQGSAQKQPIIRWYASIAVGDWTEETGLGPNVWSIPWVGTDTIYDYCIAYGVDDKLSVGAVNQVADRPYSAYGTDPLQMNNVGDTSRANNKLYFYSQGNPTATHKTVKLFGNSGVFSTSFNGLHNVKFLGLEFNLCRAVTCINAVGTSATPALNDNPVPTQNTEMMFCTFRKAFAGYWNNQNYYKNAANTTTIPTECSMSVHDCYFEKIPYNAVRVRTGGFDGSNGVAGNSYSWEIYRNVLREGNLSTSAGGALAYIQCLGGTKHHAWGNDMSDVLNGVAGNHVDGACLYGEVDSKNVVFHGNVATRCGVAYQLNCVQNGNLISNAAIDCIMHSLITGSNSNQYPNQSYKVIHNTYLWTGRIDPSELQVGPSLSKNSEAYREYVDQNIPGNTAKCTVVFANNSAYLLSSKGFVNKGAAYYNSSAAQTTAFLSCGFAAFGFNENKVVVDTGVDVSKNPSIVSITGTSKEIYNVFADPLNGVLVPVVDSLILGKGVPMTITYSDIRGKSFNAQPSPGCYEPQST